MKITAVIPARFASTRFPGKPLALISGKPMIHWVIQGVMKSQSVNQVIVATDDDRIAQAAQQAGAQVVMTDPEEPSGTDRVWAAAKELDCDIVVNVQGDEPLITSAMLDDVLSPFLAGAEVEMSTLSHPFADEEEWRSMNAVKVIKDNQGNAIYFSRFMIPHSRTDAVQSGQLKALAEKHIGLYAFKKSFLQRFCESAPSALEQAESLEQLRALHLGAKIRVVSVDHKLIGVDSPEDIPKVEAKLKETHGDKV